MIRKTSTLAVLALCASLGLGGQSQAQTLGAAAGGGAFSYAADTRVDAQAPVVNVRHRGRRHYHRRHRRGGLYVGGVLGGLALGAIIASQPRYYAPAPRYYAPPRYYKPRYRAPRYSFSPAHHGWCSTRYRSYRASDGTFQPYRGPRKLCRSPYL